MNAFMLTSTEDSPNRSESDAPKEAAELVPNTSGDTRGFLKIIWNVCPLRARPAPRSMEASILGSLMCITTAIGFFSMPISSPQA